MKPGRSSISSTHSSLTTRAFLRSAYLFSLLYGLLLAYGTLYPLSGWTTPPVNPWALLLGARTGFPSRADILTNVLVYLPFGLLLAHAFARPLSRLSAVALTTLVGSVLSTGLEYGQAFLPGRDPSRLDIALNASGTFICAVLAIGLRPEVPTGRWLTDLCRKYMQSDRVAILGLITLGLWALSQLTPLVPSFDVGNLRQGLKPLWHTLQGAVAFDAAHATVYGLSTLGLGVIAHSLFRPPHRGFWLFTGFCFTILLLKVPVVSRQLSLEAVSGVTTALLLVGVLTRMRLTLARVTAALALLGAVAVEALRPAPDPLATTASFNWIPFTGHLTHPLIGLADMLAGAWPFVALSYLAITSRSRSPVAVAFGGGLCIFATVFVLEWHQQTIPGRSADITDVLVALFAWALPWLYDHQCRSKPNTAMTPRPWRSSRLRDGV